MSHETGKPPVEQHHRGEGGARESPEVRRGAEPVGPLGPDGKGPVYKWVSRSTRKDRFGQFCRIVWKQRNGFKVTVEFLDGEQIQTTQSNMRLAAPFNRSDEAAANAAREAAQSSWNKEQTHD
ncbi:MAG: hypothetical protein QM757_26570 [Paludibaculum sp.]